MENAADILPDAGASLRAVEQRAPVVPTQTDTGMHMEKQVKEPDPSAAAGIKFTIKSFQISGNLSISTEELLSLVKVYCGDNRTFLDVDNAALRIAEYYHARGYLVAWANIPPQEVSNGRVKLSVLEGHYGQVKLKNKSQTHNDALKRFLTAAQLGYVIDAKRLDRALLLLQDTVQTGAVNGVLRAGTGTGEADLEVSVAQSRRVTGRLEADNFGVRVTGRDRVGGTLQLHSPTGRGDRLGTTILTSGHGQDYGNITYDLPIGGQGVRWGIGYTESRYRLGEEFDALDAYGRAGVWSVRATYPVMRTSRFNLYGDVSYEHKHLDDHMDSVPSDTIKRNNVGTVGLSSDHTDARGGITMYSLHLGAGSLRIETPAALANDNVTARTNGHFTKLSYSLTRYQPVVGNTVLFMSLSGQLASKNLDSAEKFSLGGPFGVRAYPVGEAAGDNGYVASAEIRYSLTQPLLGARLTLVGFSDVGNIKVNHNPFVEGGNKRHLASGGVGVTMTAPGKVDVQLTYAAKLGDARAVSDTDRSGRVWLQIVKGF